MKNSTLIIYIELDYKLLPREYNLGGANV